MTLTRLVRSIMICFVFRDCTAVSLVKSRRQATEAWPVKFGMCVTASRRTIPSLVIACLRTVLYKSGLSLKSSLRAVRDDTSLSPFPYVLVG